MKYIIESMSYSLDLRERAVSYNIREGHGQEETARIFQISRSTLKQWVKNFRETGSLEKKELNRKPWKYAPEKIREILNENPDAYLYEIAEHFENGSISGVEYALNRMGITRKKKRNITKNETRKNV
jgi:transposase